MRTPPLFVTQETPMHFALKASSDDAEAQRASQAGGSTPANTGTPGKRTRSEVARLASLARWGKYKAKGKPKGKGRKKATAKPSAEEKEAAKRQEAQANRAKLLGENSAAMDALAMGQAPDPAQADALVASGLADKLKDGTVVLNASGRQAYNAASSGDAGRVAELTARAKDKATPEAKPEEAPKGSGGGGGGSAKPTPEDKAQAKLEARAKTASDTASRVGLAADDVAALTQGRDSGGADNQRMRDVGLLDANGDTTDQGRRALVALERGDVGSFRAAMQDAANRLEREAQARQRAIEKLIKDAEKDKPQAEKPKTTRRSTRDVNGITITTRETKGMKHIKYSRRHSAQDEAHLARAVSHVKGAMGALIDAGAADDSADNLAAVVAGAMKDTLLIAAAVETKALDLMTQCELVCDAVLDAIGEDDELMHGDDCDITVYPDFAVLDTDGECYRIDYTIENGDVSLADASEWQRVQWDVSEIDGAEPGYEAEADDAPRVVIGDAVKMLDGGKIGAYAVRFGTADEPDLSQMRDYFTKSTDFWLDAWRERPMLYHHAQDPMTADNPIIGNWTKAIKDEVGIWLEGQLDKAHKYYSAINEMVKQGALKLSSDSAPHLVRRHRVRDDVNEVVRWPLMAASLTPTPAEPRLLPVSALKAIYAAEFPPVFIDDPQTPALEVAAAIKSDARERLLALELELISIEEMELV